MGATTKLFIEPGMLNDQNQTGTDQTQTVTRTEYIPIFFNNSNISVSNTSALVKNTDSNEEVVFGPGKLRFILTPFDNLIKLKVYTSNSSISSTTPIPLDLN
jgi:hypothetical protein